MYLLLGAPGNHRAGLEGLQHRANAEGVSSEGAPPGGSRPPQQLGAVRSSSAITRQGHMAVTGGPPKLAKLGGRFIQVVSLPCPYSPRGGRCFCPPPFTGEGPEAQREKSIHSSSHHRKCWRTGHLPLSSSLQESGLNRGLSTCWQPPAHP